ncbi:hypothetical protein ACOMHN_051918 [Nucella lapillus]
MVPVKQHQFLCCWRLAAQSSAETRDKISCCPRNRPHRSWLVQELAGVDQHHVWCRCVVDRHTKTLDEHSLVSFPQTPELVDERWRYGTEFVLEDVCRLHTTLLPNDLKPYE